MIDTTIRFNDHNSYKVTTPLFCYPFGVESMPHITHSFQAYATSSLASATRARTKFFDADGATISDVSHTFAVTTVFGKIDITVAVPATAVQAQLVLLQGGTDWWIAEPKSEQGEVATPYNVNYQGQLTYITPNGIYTGMLTASQIVVTGTTASPTEDLEQRLVTINNNAINLSSTVNGVVTKTTLITSGGVYTGEIVATQITSGSISADRIASLSITGDKIAAGTITGAKIAAGTITADKINVTNLAVQKLTSGDFRQYFVASAGDWASLDGYDLDYSSTSPAWTMLGSGIQKWISVSAGGANLISIKDAQTYVGSANFQMYHESTYNAWHVGRVGSSVSGYFNVGSGIYDSNAIEMVRGNGLYALGVDSSGAYYRKNSSTKTYF